MAAGSSMRARRIACAALAFGCLMAFARAFTAGFALDAFARAAGQREAAAFACACARFAAFAVIAVLGCLKVRILGKAVLSAAGVCGAVAAALLAAAPGTLAVVAAGVFAGLSSGALVFALMLLLGSCSLRDIVFGSVAGLVLGGALIGLLLNLAGGAGIVCLIIICVSAALALIGVDSALAYCGTDGTFTSAELGRFPWFASVMLVACGMLGSALYGMAGALDWDVMAGASYPVMGVCSLLVIGCTLAVMLRAENWTQLVWVPLFVLLACVLALMCTSGHMLGSTALGLLLAIVMSFHFLRWAVFPAIVSTSLLPRYFTTGVFLVLSNSIMGIDLGAALAGAVPPGLRDPASLAGVVALALALVLAVVVLVDRAGRAAEYEEPAEPPAEAASGRGGAPGAAQPTLEERCAQMAGECGLTAREREIFAMTARGHSSTFIAEQLVISSSTVRFHQQNLYRKLDVHSKQELINLVESRSA